eukprot:365942-Chlamydomonas_euryale.AAC.43
MHKRSIAATELRTFTQSHLELVRYGTEALHVGEAGPALWSMAVGDVSRTHLDSAAILTLLNVNEQTDFQASVSVTMRTCIVAGAWVRPERPGRAPAS